MNWHNKINELKEGDKIRLLGTKEGSEGLFNQWFKERQKGDICKIKSIAKEEYRTPHYFVAKVLNNESLGTESSGFLVEEDFERVI